MTTLTADRFPTVAVLDQIGDGHAVGRLATTPVDGCLACQTPRRLHGTRWGASGRHQWLEPGALTRKLRILARHRMREAIERNRTEYATVMAEYRAADAA